MSVAVNNNVENHDEHHHKETFITKWIFSQDHKMIAKQYFITCLLYTSPSPRDSVVSRMPSSA